MSNIQGRANVVVKVKKFEWVGEKSEKESRRAGRGPSRKTTTQEQSKREPGSPRVPFRAEYPQWAAVCVSPEWKEEFERRMATGVPVESPSWGGVKYSWEEWEKWAAEDEWTAGRIPE